MFRRRTMSWASALAALTAGCSLVVAAPAVAQPDAGDDGSVRPNPPVVSADQLGVDGSIATVPWRAEQLADGRVQIILGGINNVPVSPDAVAVASDVPEGSDAMAAASWSCNMHHGEYTTVRAGNYLRGVAHVDCWGVESHRVNWQFMRSSWSGYRPYTNLAYGGFVSDVTNASTKYAYCWGGGTYNYKLRYWSEVNYGGQLRRGPYAENNTAREPCGTGVS